MIEIEVYAAGVRSLDRILELDSEFEVIHGLRYKIDSNHDIVYMEMDEPLLSLQQIKAIFRKCNLEPRIVGAVNPELNQKSKTQPLNLGL